MGIRTSLRSLAGPLLKQYPRLWKRLIEADLQVEKARHSAARYLPVLIRPEPRNLEVARDVVEVCEEP